MEKNNKKKICIIAPSLGMGGIERHLSLLADYFQDNGAQVHYVVVYNKKPFYTINRDVFLHQSSLTRSNENKLTYNIKQFLFVRKQVKKIKPDIIFSLGDALNSYLLFSLYGLKYPHIISDGGSPNLKYPLHLKILRKLFYPKSIAVIAQTEAAKKVKQEMLGVNFPIKVIPNPARKITLYPEIERKNIILFIGRLHHEKGLGDLITIFNQIEHKDEWKLQIAGSGIHEQIFRKQVKDLGLENSVEFLGKISDIDSLLAGVKIFAFSSYGEGFPNALLEALSAGVPTVSYDCVAGPSEMIIDGENGFLIEVGNKTQFIEKIQYLIENESVRIQMGVNALKVYNKFRLEKVGKEYLDYLLSFIKR